MDRHVTAHPNEHWTCEVHIVGRSAYAVSKQCRWPLHWLTLNAVFTAVGLVAFGCGVTTPVPDRGVHHPSEPFESVSRQPDTVEVQVLPPRPDEESVWIDGHWQWVRRRWEWKEGAWERPIRGSRYARPDYVRRFVPESSDDSDDAQEAGQAAEQKDGEQRVRRYRVDYQYRPGRWYGSDGGVLEEAGSPGDAGTTTGAP